MTAVVMQNPSLIGPVPLPVGPCVLWTGRCDDEGYGRSNRHLVHRRAWEKTYGPIPAGMQIDHLCAVRNCYALAHLEVVTPAENRRRTALRQEKCRHGHHFTPKNTYMARRKDGSMFRRCRLCNAAMQRRRYAARKVVR